MNERIVFTTPNGSCGVLIPTGEAMIEINTLKAKAVIEASVKLEDETREEFEARLINDISGVTLDRAGFLDLIQNKDVPLLITNDIVFPDESVIVAGTLIKIADLFYEAVKQGLTEEDVALMITNMSEQLPSRQITTAELPNDRLFRNAWDDRNPENYIGLNANKALEIAHGMRRADRDVKMIPLDREDAFVSTTVDRKAAIVIEKQTILDANALTQSDINATVNGQGVLDETALRVVLNTVGVT